jgi:hypothetical protein
MKKIFLKSISVIIISAFLISCAEDQIGPTIDLTGANFVSAELTNAATAEPVELLPENANNQFEEFEWMPSEYGVSVPVNYVLELAAASSFENPVALTTTATTSFAITVTKFNDATLTAGLTAFAEGAVFIRVRSIVAGGVDVDTLISESISRTVTPYRLSDCGTFCTVGVIGSATKGGWDIDSDMRLFDQTGADRSTWTATLYLVAGEVKFRASDAWDTNWGNTGYPTGTGTLNGPNIPIATPGWYTITFNDGTAGYEFEILAPTTFATIGVIGPAQAGGWDADTDMTQDPGDPHVWTTTLTLADGSAKFRANDAWDNNWGSASYPSGRGVHNGADIAVTAGTYTIYFNDVTGEYSFNSDGTEYATVGIIGPATDGGWDSDTDLIPNPNNPYLFSATLTLSDGEAKFRADNDWANNWGASTFPDGLGIKNGPNIPVTAAKYVVKFNSGTGEYLLLK